MATVEILWFFNRLIIEILLTCLLFADECESEGGLVSRMVCGGGGVGGAAGGLIQSTTTSPGALTSSTGRGSDGGAGGMGPGGAQCGTLNQPYAGDMCTYGPMYGAYGYGSMKSRASPYTRSSPVYPPPYPAPTQLNSQLYRQAPTYHDYTTR